MLIYLLSFPQVLQLMKLPELVQHFIQHKKHDPETTVYSFIKMHYLDAPIKDADWKDDMKLPFKSHDFSAAALTVTIPPRKLEIPVALTDVRVLASRQFFYQESLYPPIFRAIWQPPKI